MFKLTQNVLKFQLIKRCFATVEELQGTLHLRFLDHITATKIDKNVKPASDTKLTTMLRMVEPPNKIHENVLRTRCKEINLECIKKLRGKSTEEIFTLLDDLIRAVPSKVVDLSFYPVAVKRCLSWFRKNPKPETFVKVCFYLGLFKKKSPGPTLLTDVIESHLQSMIDSLSTIDFAIVCMAAYKNSVRIPAKEFEKRLVWEITKDGPIDEYIFITFVKTLRMNRIYSPQVLEKLRKWHKTDQLKILNEQALTHTFAYIADNFVKDDQLAVGIVDLFVTALNTKTRAKDIQKILYSSALLNLQLPKEYLTKLEDQVLNRVHHKEFNQKFENFIEATLSLWMLGHRSQKLSELVINDSRFKVSGDPNRVKIDSKKTLLMTCIEIEQPSWLKSFDIESPVFDEFRPAPKFLNKPSLNKKMEHLSPQSPQLVQQIKNLNIAGIAVKQSDSETIHYEVLDEKNCLSDKTSPNGIFALKLRLLKKLGCKVEMVGIKHFK